MHAQQSRYGESAEWEASPLGRASRVVQEDLEDLAASGDVVAAVTAGPTTVAWIAGGPGARRAARLEVPAERYAGMVRGRVRHTAPILDPATGGQLGVLELAAPPEGAGAALRTAAHALARCIEHELEATSPPGRRRTATGAGPAATRAPAEGLVLRSLGAPEVLVDGIPAALTRRQLELLVVLSLHPEGMSLDQLAGRVYGDHPVSPSTVKAELSHLRHLLGGRIGSRPYRLLGPVDCDHHRLLDAVAAGDTATAASVYGGPMLAFSDSPDVVAWRHHVDASVRDAALRSHDADVLWALSGHCPDDVAVHEAALDALADDDARRSVVVGRVAAAGGG